MKTEKQPTCHFRHGPKLKICGQPAILTYRDGIRIRIYHRALTLCMKHRLEIQAKETPQ